MTTALAEWFANSQRDLPWRRRPEPYRVWVSEIMLQQTQVATVVPYFERFVDRFPTPSSLAAADEAEVLKHWEGLGYYRRARSIHAAAKVICDRHEGVFPTDFDSVLALPGIGRYTAGAILSIALNQSHPILEGNTIRVHSRLFAVTDDIGQASTQKRLWECADQVVRQATRSGVPPGTINQALMELGASLCRVKQPACDDCPVAKWCSARERGIAESLPRNDRKSKFESRREAVLLVERRGKWLVRRCGADERWAGLWDFPRFDVTHAPCDASRLSAELEQRCGLRVSLLDTGWSHRHAVTRFRIELGCWRATQVDGRLRVSAEDRSRQVEWSWATRGDLEDLPLSATGRIVVNRLERLADSPCD
ncbi:MAG: A/G-specific adenine glycosylase [Planctomycetales bacterium]|nr:A/G-specific adenine glycosylase [Planctomycetales bacterium]